MRKRIINLVILMLFIGTVSLAMPTKVNAQFLPSQNIKETLNYQAVNSDKVNPTLSDLDIGAHSLTSLKSTDVYTAQQQNLLDKTKQTKGGNLQVKKVLTYIISIAFLGFALYKILEMRK